MAKPIKETPILTGNDAVNFTQLMKEAETKKISAAEMAKIKSNSDRIRIISIN